jgi:hypothetical protein
MDKISEEWRKECEARELLTWPLAKRRKQLDLVEQKRGWQARLELQDEMEKQWQSNQNKRQNLSLNTQKNMQKPTQGELL